MSSLKDAGLFLLSLLSGHNKTTPPHSQDYFLYLRVKAVSVDLNKKVVSVILQVQLLLKDLAKHLLIVPINLIHHLRF